MKQIILKYANEVNDITRPLDFFTVIDQLKYDIIITLIFLKAEEEKNVDILYDDIFEDNKFVQEMTIKYNNILSRQLDNDEKLLCPKKYICNISTKASV